jgi:hypothetical protein
MGSLQRGVLQKRAGGSGIAPETWGPAGGKSHMMSNVEHRVSYRSAEKLEQQTSHLAPNAWGPARGGRGHMMSRTYMIMRESSYMWVQSPSQMV